MELGGYLILYYTMVVVAVFLLVCCFYKRMCHESCYTPDATFTPYDDLPTVIYYRKPDSAFIDKEHFLKAVTKLEEANSNSSSSYSSTGLIGEAV